MDWRRGGHHRRQPERHRFCERLRHRKGSSRHSECRLEGDLQKSCASSSSAAPRS
jgi:hypothetical protein